jgi:ABC-type transport system involved in cytochrome bd biosynthesis fused ATPase/permease subunit
VELSAATPELTLLGRAALADTRSERATAALQSAEYDLRRYRRSSNAVVFVVSILALVGVVSHPTTSSVWLVVAAMIGLANFDLLSSIGSSLHAAIEVSGGGERLEALATTAHAGTHAWPDDVTLRAEHLTLDEDGRTLVRDADLTVSPGQRLAIVGESGVGKSTLLRALSRLDPATLGSITIGNVSISDIAEDEFRRHVTYVASEPGLTRGYAVDVVALGRSSERDPHRDLAMLGVESDRTTRFEELSRGERVRVAIARALVTSPSIYVLDEPTAGLGRDETARVLDLLAATGATIIVATHDRDVTTWCDVVVELRACELLRVTN